VLGEAALGEHRQRVLQPPVPRACDDAAVGWIELELGFRSQHLACQDSEALDERTILRRRAQLLHGGVCLPPNVVVDRTLGLENEGSRSAARLRELGDRLELCSRLALGARAGDQRCSLFLGLLDLRGRAVRRLANDTIRGRLRLGEERVAHGVEA
jgi:hypothetical protein